MKKKFNFEDAILSLRQITQELEGQTLSLDESLKKYKEAIDLISACNKQLSEATLKVETIDIDAKNIKGDEDAIE